MPEQQATAELPREPAEPPAILAALEAAKKLPRGKPHPSPIADLAKLILSPASDAREDELVKTATRMSGVVCTGIASESPGAVVFDCGIIREIDEKADDKADEKPEGKGKPSKTVCVYMATYTWTYDERGTLLSANLEETGEILRPGDDEDEPEGDGGTP